MSCVPRLTVQFICLLTCIQGLISKGQAEEAQPGGTAERTARFSSVISPPLAQNNPYMTDFFSVKTLVSVPQRQKSCRGLQKPTFS